MSKVDIERVLTQGNPDGLTQEQIKQAQKESSAAGASS